MQIPAQMKKQVAERTALLEEMMSKGEIATPIEHLVVPTMLVMHESDECLSAMHKRLMRTRKPYIEFGLNGRIYLVRRKVAIGLVNAERKLRLP